MLQKIVDLFEREPVRVRMYAILVPVVGLLAYLDVFSGGTADQILTIAAAALGVAATEGARKKVAPEAKYKPKYAIDARADHDGAELGDENQDIERDADIEFEGDLLAGEGVDFDDSGNLAIEDNDDSAR